MIEWYIAVRHDRAVSTNKYGRFFKRYLDAGTWAELEATFADADIENNWQALFNTIDLFRKLAKYVADNLGYEYPDETDRKITAYCKKARALRNGP